MKKRILAGMLIFAMAISLVACSGGSTEKKEDKKEAEDEAPEQKVVKWNYGTSGNVLVTIANEKGYFEDEGIEIEPVEANANGRCYDTACYG